MLEGTGGKAGKNVATVTVIDQSLLDLKFWALAITLNALFGVIRTIIEWVEGCPCHSHMDWSSLATEVGTMSTPWEKIGRACIW